MTLAIFPVLLSTAIYRVSLAAVSGSYRSAGAKPRRHIRILQNLAGAEGFEPPSPVLETGSLTVELTPLFWLSAFGHRLSVLTREAKADSRQLYFTSLCAWCLRQRGQNFENSRRSVVVFLFFIVV
jgi:hypothetical protein